MLDSDPKLPAIIAAEDFVISEGAFNSDEPLHQLNYLADGPAFIGVIELVDMRAAKADFRLLLLG